MASKTLLNYNILKRWLSSAEIQTWKFKHKTKIPPKPIPSQLPSDKNVDFVLDDDLIRFLETQSQVKCCDEVVKSIIKGSIEFAQPLQSIDTSNVTPLVTLLEDKPNQMRADKPEELIARDKLMRNASVTEDNYFVAPPGHVQ